jgi:hypothetical protein
MAARKLDYAYDESDEIAALETCLHDQQRTSRSPTSSGFYRRDVDAVTRSGVVPVSRTSAPSPPSIPRAGTVPAFVIGERISAFELHAPPRTLPIASLLVATFMFLVMTVVASIAYYR